MAKNLFFIFIIAALLLSACGNSDTDETIPALDLATGESYFFLEEGQFREYEVFEIRYRAVDISDTLEYFLREEVRESFTDDGVRANIIHRFTRLNENEEWELDSVWSARIENQRAISVENNIPIVKMVFPPLQESEWNGNSFNPRPEDIFRVVTFDPAQDEDNNTTFSVPIPGRAIAFSEVLVVEQNQEEDNITFRDNRVEVYKDSIGLVFKQYDDVKICSRPECVGLGLVESGRFYRELLIGEGTFDVTGG